MKKITIAIIAIICLTFTGCAGVKTHQEELPNSEPQYITIEPGLRLIANREDKAQYVTMLDITLQLEYALTTYKAIGEYFKQFKHGEGISLMNKRASEIQEILDKMGVKVSEE